MFKVKYNKLLTKSNVRDREIKYKKTIQSPYEDDICPSCQIEQETVEHVMLCSEHETYWKKTNKHILSIINSYSTMSKHDEWKKNQLPYSRKIENFPTWLDQHCASTYKKFNWRIGRLGLLPLEIKETLKKFGIKEIFLDKCITNCHI